MELMSCICPTFGRIPNYMHLLEEVIYWFDRQTYPHKELIILNDAPEQFLMCNHPQVKILNVPKRFPTLGQKYDVLVDVAQGTIIVPWEDDDISLPNRLHQVWEKLGGMQADYFNPQQSWYEQSGKLHRDHKHGVCHNASAYRKSLWEIAGGYGTDCGNQDAVFDRKCKEKGKVATPLHSCSQWTYIYRWGVSPTHLSGAGNMQQFYDSVKAENALAVLTPRMRIDYVEEVTKALNGKTCGKCTGACTNKKEKVLN